MHAAIFSGTGMIFLGKHHGDCFNQAFNVGIKVQSAAWAQGFFTSKGRFVSRAQAAEIAIAAGQVPPEIKTLFSEDLWSPTDGGKFIYDSVDGYIEARSGK